MYSFVGQFYCRLTKFALCFALLLCSIAVYSQEKKWTLEECIEYALEHNIDVKQVDLDMQRSKVSRQSAWGNFLPSINANANHSWTLGLNQNITTGILENQTTQFTSSGVDVNIDIFKGLQNHNELLKSRLSLLSSKYKSQKIREDIALNVINAYLQIIFNKELVKTNESQMLYDNQQLLRTKELVDVGVVPSGDLLDIKATVAYDKQKLIAAKNTLLISKLSLAQLLQIEEFQFFDIADTDYEIIHSELLLQSPDQIFEKAKTSQVDISLAETNVEIAKKSVQIARGMFFPTIRGFYSFATRAAYNNQITGQQIDSNNPTKIIGVVEETNQRVIQPNFLPIISGPDPLLHQFDRNKGHSFGIGITVPVFSGWKIRNNFRMSKIALQQIENEKELTELKLKQSVYTAYTDTQSALENFEASKATLEARLHSLNYAKERYEVGLINIFELNQIQTLFVNAQSEVLRAKYDYIFKTKVLEYYFGYPIFESKDYEKEN